MKRKILILCLLLSVSILLAGTEFDKIKDSISEFTLENGLKFILIEDHSVPIASFVTYANVGASDERIGIYGISHFLEHLAFKGTSEIGTKNVKKEKIIFSKMGKIFSQIKAERGQIKPDKQKIEELFQKLNDMKKEVSQYVVPNEFTTILNKNGVVGLNAGTGCDSTSYYFSLPSNKLELWAYLESSRFKDPVFREFYKERQVIKEERRTTTENKPIGKCIEEFQSLAFKDQPYRQSVIGPISNIDNISRQDVNDYFNKYYVAKNMAIGVAGDVTVAQLKEVAKKYFSKIPMGRKIGRRVTIDPPQAGEKRLTMYENSQPWLIIGYHCPSVLNKDFIKMQLLKYVISDGRSSRLQKKIMIKNRSAMYIGSFAGFPGDKYPGLYLLYTLANRGHSNESLEKEILFEIDDLKKNPISKEELLSAKTRMKVDLIREYESDSSLLSALLKFEMVIGSWENCFSSFSDLEKITALELQDVVKKYMGVNSRVIVKIEKKKEAVK